jgi:membrane glycosyltransferase
MTSALAPDHLLRLDAERPDGFTPAGLQRRAALRRRRALFAALVAASLAGLGWGVGAALGAGGWSASDIVILGAFLIGAPWTVVGFWNAALGLWVLHTGRLAAAAPVAQPPAPEPLRLRVALTMCLRNEDPSRAFARLLAIRESLDAAGEGAAFDAFILSDSSDAAVIAEEDRLFARLRPRLGAGARLRRRASNEGFKAGNLRDFLRRWGGDYALFLPLDSDSLMSGETILRMARVMQAHPRLGVLQSLVVGAPSDSLFARLFQFGMRHGMRSYAAGAVWWQGDACAYWGHNALIRCAPFRARCRLPRLPGEPPLGGPVLSHDQVEAALMRRAGWEVRVLPVETESFEDNPPTLLDFLKRDHRWCNGNMQYWRLLGLPGLKPVGRFHLIAAIAMYMGAAAWMAMTAAAVLKLAEGDAADIDLALGITMFFIMFSVSLAPKVAGWIDVALTPGGFARYGGRRRFAAGAAAETLFSALLAPVAALAATIFMIGLAFGRRIAWSGQARDLTRVSWAKAARAMWPQTLAGVGLAALLAWRAPEALPWAAPVLAGLTVSIPFAVLTASPRLGRWARRVGLCATPEERDPPAVLAALAAPPSPEARAA